MAWHSTVARAAPCIPMPSPKMKMGSRMAFDATVNRVRPMASLGLPAALIMPLKPKYRCVMTLPSSMMNM